MIVSDQRMPNMTGSSSCARAKGYSRRRCARLWLHRAAVDHRCYQQSAIYKFLTKPWDDEQLRANIAEGLPAQGASMMKTGSPARSCSAPTPGWPEV